MSIVDAMLQRNPNLRVAVIDKDEPGGICLARGCIPSKILLFRFPIFVFSTPFTVLNPNKEPMSEWAQGVPA